MIFEHELIARSITAKIRHDGGRAASDASRLLSSADGSISTLFGTRKILEQVLHAGEPVRVVVAIPPDFPPPTRARRGRARSAWRP